VKETTEQSESRVLDELTALGVTLIHDPNDAW
jgi:hypothetical protein